MRMTIRDATHADVEALNDVYRRSALSNESDRELLLADPSTLALTAADLDAGRTRVAIVEERLVAFARFVVHPDRLELDDLFVDPGHVRGGLGRALVEDAEAIARAAAVDHLEVTANAHARRFYERVGFATIGSVGTPLGLPAWRMRRRVGP